LEPPCHGSWKNVCGLGTKFNKDANRRWIQHAKKKKGVTEVTPLLVAGCTL
jgi:hypothetical protein